ncbi:MAG: helix-turn-helix domain-containing protein [Deltaproteobacteria bacterium]|nr:helix-turn-helix domain-containing protein [Deltaproteobacteria bacterium]
MKIRDARNGNWFWVENALIDRDDLNIYEKTLYMTFCRFVDKNSKCRPSLQAISTAAGFSKRKAADTIKSMIEKGLIEKKRRITENGDPTSNEYTVLSAVEKRVV